MIPVCEGEHQKISRVRVEIGSDRIGSQKMEREGAEALRASRREAQRRVEAPSRASRRRHREVARARASASRAAARRSVISGSSK